VTSPHIPGSLDIEQIELKGFSRSIAEIEWLLLILILLYHVSPGAEVANPFGLSLSMIAFAGFILVFHYLNFYERQTRWKLAIETWVMIAFITWVLWNTGKADSSLLNLYLLVIIASAITLGKLTTFLEVTLIAAFYIFLNSHIREGFTLGEFTALMTTFSPFLLIAYITAMLAADVHYGKKMFKELAELDDMTGLLNKRSFRVMLSRETQLAERYSHSLSYMIIDADNLKEINDKYGHTAGDQLIKAIAKNIKRCLRSTDVVSRFGGDEFVALLPRMDGKGAVVIGERIRSCIENTSFDSGGKCITSSVCIGIATFPEDADSMDEVMEKADAALYQGKQGGRNRVSHIAITDNSQTEINSAPVSAAA